MRFLFWKIVAPFSSTISTLIFTQMVFSINWNQLVFAPFQWSCVHLLKRPLRFEASADDRSQWPIWPLVHQILFSAGTTRGTRRLVTSRVFLTHSNNVGKNWGYFFCAFFKKTCQQGVTEDKSEKNRPTYLSAAATTTTTRWQHCGLPLHFTNNNNRGTGAQWDGKKSLCYSNHLQWKPREPFNTH